MDCKYNTNINTVIIYGNKLNKNNYSKIFEGFYLAFKHLNYNTHWISDEEISILDNLNLDKSLFIVSGIENKNIPIDNKYFYVLYKCNDQKFNQIYENRKFILTEYSDNIDKTIFRPKLEFKFIYYKSESEYELIMPWATELLPYQIQNNINELNKNIKKLNKNAYIYKYASKTELKSFNQFKSIAVENNNNFRLLYKYIEPKIMYVRNIKEAFYPLVILDNNVKNSIIDIDIFKILSYGNIPVTNCKFANEYFNNKLIYGSRNQTLYKRRNLYNFEDNKSNIINLMTDIKKNHCFLHRAYNIIQYVHFIIKKTE